MGVNCFLSSSEPHILIQTNMIFAVVVAALLCSSASASPSDARRALNQIQLSAAAAAYVNPNAPCGSATRQDSLEDAAFIVDVLDAINGNGLTDELPTGE